MTQMPKGNADLKEVEILQIENLRKSALRSICVICVPFYYERKLF
jgi:hypothetical protein